MAPGSRPGAGESPLPATLREDGASATRNRGRAEKAGEQRLTCRFMG